MQFLKSDNRLFVTGTYQKMKIVMSYTVIVLYVLHTGKSGSLDQQARLQK